MNQGTAFQRRASPKLAVNLGMLCRANIKALVGHRLSSEENRPVDHCSKDPVHIQPVQSPKSRRQAKAGGADFVRSSLAGLNPIGDVNL
jgi:hypothetical protein